MSQQSIFDEGEKPHFSEATVKILNIFPGLLAKQEAMLRGYHGHLPAVPFVSSE